MSYTVTDNEVLSGIHGQFSSRFDSRFDSNLNQHQVQFVFDRMPTANSQVLIYILFWVNIECAVVYGYDICLLLYVQN